MTEFEPSLAAPYIEGIGPFNTAEELVTALRAPDIEALAREAGVEATAAAINGLLRWCIPNPYHVRPENAALYSPAAVAAIVQKAVEAERERAAALVDAEAALLLASHPSSLRYTFTLEAVANQFRMLAAAIRARGEG